MSSQTWTAGALDVAVAQREDDADIRRLLREHAMEGWIRLSLEREPDAFAAAAPMGRAHSYIIARERQTGKAVAICEWAARDCYVDGEARLVPYLGALRADTSRRRSISVLKAGFDALRHLLHAPGGFPYALTTIGADNAPALRLLGANLPGMPTYRPLAAISTFALATAGARRIPSYVEQARSDDLAAIAVCLERAYRRFQFAPVWNAARLLAHCPGLGAEDFLVVRRGPGIAACVALWDQGAFKQTVVRGYGGRSGRLRPLANLLAPLLRLPHLPAPGEALRQIYLSHLAVEDDDPALLAALIDAALATARRRGFPLALTGLAERHPRAAAMRRRYWLRHYEYRSLLHVVHWEDGRAAAEAVAAQARLPHVEIAVL